MSRDKELAEAVAEHLTDIANLVREGRYEEIENYTSFSSGGDGYGDGNTYLDFCRVDEIKDALGGCYAEDIGDILDELRKLKYNLI